VARASARCGELQFDVAPGRDPACYDETVTRRDEWQRVLDAETKRWSAMSCDQLISELADHQAYELEFESKKYQVEVELLENTGEYIHVMVAVDDGSLPASIRPSISTFIRHKDSAATEE
jgi:hypothetical protein